ncbi:MAG: Ig-like domain-containing protein [Peptococcaceae bacterium]|nr:Ig-like domain-containing protein [Peptococcaceae bacterium]
MKRVVSFFLIFILVVPYALAVPKAQAAPASGPGKKAVYLLPGFMESRLYSQRYGGMEIWVGPGLATEIGRNALGLQPEMANNVAGEGMLAYADRNRDRIGTLASFLPLISSINSCLALNGLSNVYTVEFFSYNYLADLNDTAKELAADIKAKGYESVILVGHSNGGLLASTYIAQSAENKNKVEKTILLASPLLGTFTALEPVETGGLTLFDGSFIMTLLELGYDIFAKPISKDWVKSWARNSPNVYQLMAGNEYVSKTPVLYRTPSGLQTINTPEGYYALLNQSPNTNANLVSGNTRSLKYFRETVFGGHVLDLWEGMDLTLIGCEYGFVTPVSALYHQSGSRAIYDGAIYSKAGDGIVAGMSMNGDERYNFVNLPGASHIPILLDIRALAVVNDVIMGRSVSNNSVASNASQTSSDLPSVGMSDMIRVEIKSSDPLSAATLNSGLDVRVYDKKGKTVARAKGEAQQGFTENNFVYSSWNTIENATNILCYIPKDGYTMEVFTGSANRLGCIVTVCTETLEPSGGILSRNEYRVTGANLLSGSMFTLDSGKSMAPVPKIGARLSTVSSEKYAQNWQFVSNALSLGAGGSAIPEIVGPDAARAAGNCIWTSSDPTVATVSSTGLITGKRPGKAVITAAAKDNSLKMESCTVTVGD